MSIGFCRQSGVFHIRAGETSYLLQLFRGKYPVHLFWGKKIRGTGCERLLQVKDRPFSPHPDPLDRSWSLDTLPMEYPSYGNSDFRIPAFTVRQENGSEITDLSYVSHRIFRGKPVLEGLPATYVENQDEAETLELELDDRTAGLRVVLSYTGFEALDAITRSVKFVNTGSRVLKVRKAMSMSLDFPGSDFEMVQLSGSWARERHIVRRKLVPGLQAVESRRGSSSHQQNPFMALLGPHADEETGEVFGFSLVYSGNFSAGVETDQFGSTRAFMGINPFGFGWTLLPGETFQTPEAVMVHSPDGLGGMSRTFHRLYRSRLCRGKFRDTCRPVLLNSWEAAYFDFDAEKLVSTARSAKDLGIDLLVLDDGWFGERHDDTSSLGDWVPNPRKLPGGLRPLADRITALGLKFGLWFEPEMVSPDSDLYRRHPDWCLHVPDRIGSESRNQLVLDFSREDVREEILRMLTGILRTMPVSYVKWDCNRHLTETGSAALPSDRQEETAHRHLLGVYRVMETITGMFPDILFESCSGGGGRFDPGMLYYMPQAWTSDDTDAVERLEIQYGTSLVYPAGAMTCHVSAVPNHQVGRTTPLATRGHVAMFGVPGFEFDPSSLTPDERDSVRLQVRTFRELAGLIGTGDLYRLRSPFEGNEAAWMFVSEDRTEALITFVSVLAVPNGPPVRIFPKGLDPDADYEVEGEPGVSGGDLLMHAGIRVPTASGDFQSRLWRLKAVRSPGKADSA